ncbi:uncharacterized protein LOC133736044 [Rosa rugosa]|uniref:uncharacterized protein LOC133736044 n=1 Tax=Rosa rugosa TaxID=74645 RepID=UPI002B415DAE|nr:uncharacterized protein LOC133736044 [Rosa rugosa]
MTTTVTGSRESPDERRNISTVVYQDHINRSFTSSAGVDVLPIRFRLFKVTANYNPILHDYDLETPIPISTHVYLLRFSAEWRSWNSKITMERLARYQRTIAKCGWQMDKLVDKLARYLSDTVGVEEDQHPCIILKTVEMIQAAVHDRVIDVQMSDITFIEPEPEPEEESELEEESEPEEESEQEEESETEEDSEQEGFEDLDDTSYGDNLTPASESFMEDLKKLRVLGSELEMLGQTPNCAICLEVLAEEGYDDQLITITRLPCLHYYHRDCIIKWMMINNLCPVCRRQNVEAGEI